jgi:hypothetical protein
MFLGEVSIRAIKTIYKPLMAIRIDVSFELRPLQGAKKLYNTSRALPTAMNDLHIGLETCTPHEMKTR